MTKKILILYFTQSGQLTEILNNYTQSFRTKGHEVETICVKPQTVYPFPWTSKEFFSVMPDCVLGRNIALEEMHFKYDRYDLVVLGYQPWFLSPSLPITSLLNNSKVITLLENTPVVTITGARNMWISALERIKKSLGHSKAKLVGNIALVDRNANLISVVTILYWMLSGKKDRFLGVFPKPGVSEEDILACKLYGELSEKHLANGDWTSLQTELLDQKAVVVNYNLLFTETKATRLFKIWANFIDKRSNKSFWLSVFKYYLIIALFIFAPLIISINSLFVKPFIKSRIKKQITYYSGVNL